MANVRKVTHRRRKDGAAKVSWRATWKGPDGKRQSKNFAKKGDADAFLRTVDLGLAGGSTTMSIEDLAKAHYAYFDGLVREGLREAKTLEGYGTHLDKHLAADPEFAKLRLCDLTTPRAQQFLDDLLPRTGSIEVARRVRRSLVTWCKFGQRKGWLVANPAQPCQVERISRPDAGEEALEIPSKEQLGQLLAAAEQGPEPARDAAIVRLLMFGGFRISELLGLADSAINFTGERATVRVREKLDTTFGTLGRVKSASARRDVPIGPAGARAAKAWRLRRGPAKAFTVRDKAGQVERVTGRLFPCPETGGLWAYQDWLRGCWRPMLERAGLLERLRDSKGLRRPVAAFGPHTLRHVAASLWIEQGLQPKKVQQLLGHATLAMTMDLYGHLWTDEAADEALAQASERLVPIANPRN